MAKTTPDAFNEFKSKLELTDKQQEAINARRDATIGYVKSAFPSTSDLPFRDGKLISSASRNTIIRPVDNIQEPAASAQPPLTPSTSKAQQMRVAVSRPGSRSPLSSIARPVTDSWAVSASCC